MSKRSTRPDRRTSPPTHGTIRAGLHLPGVIAFSIHSSARESGENVIAEVRRLESFGWLDCPSCGTRQDFAFLRDDEIDELAEIARTRPYRELYLDVEKRFAAWTPQCACGAKWKVDPHVGGRENESDLPF